MLTSTLRRCQRARAVLEELRRTIREAAPVAEERISYRMPAYFHHTMLLTSYFAKSAKHPGAVSIARFPPKWYTGARYPQLAPAPDMLKVRDWDEYRRRYRQEILSVLDPDKVLEDLNNLCPGHDTVLLCFEKDQAHCHRGLVAEWFFERKGIAVLELGPESGGQQTL
jgi:hypothetical protein